MKYRQMRLVLPILSILCFVGVSFTNAQSSNNTGQILSLYMENAEKTASTIIELSGKLPLFIEVAQGQKDIILTLLEIRQFNLSKNKIIESMFDYYTVAKLVQSQFFINFNYRIEEDADTILFQGKLFLSSYIHMYWLNKMGLDDEASLKLLFSYFINSKTKSFLIQKGVLDSIGSQYIEGPSPDLTVINKAHESQKKYQSELASSQFIDSKLQESKLFMNISMYSKEGVLKNYQEVFTKIEPYFYIFTTSELDSIFREIMALTLSEAHKDIMIENTIFEALYNRTSVLIDPKNISYGFQEIDQHMISVYIEKEDAAMSHLLQYYKDVRVQLIEVSEDQFENLIRRIAKVLNQSEKQVQTKIIKSSLSLNHIHLLTESKCLQNMSEDDEIQIIFKDKKYLLSLLIEIQKNLKDGLSFQDALKNASLSLISRVGSDQFYRIVQNIVGKRTLFYIFNSILDIFIKTLPKGVYNTIASGFFQKEVGGSAAQTAFRKILRTQIVSSSLVGGLFIAWDVIQLMRGEILEDEFIQKTAAGLAATTLGALGASFGIALGPVGSGFGAFVGGSVGYVLGYYGSSFIPKTAIGILANKILNEINFYSNILYQSEIKITFKMFKAYLSATYDTFEKDSKSEESQDIIFEFYRRYVIQTLIGEIQRRQPHCIDFKTGK